MADRTRDGVGLGRHLAQVLRFLGPDWGPKRKGPGETNRGTQKLAPADSIGYFTYDIIAEVGAIRLSEQTLVSLGKIRTVSSGEMLVDTAATGSVQLNVSLDKRAAKEVYGVISTGLDVPLGHTVVLGTAATQKGGRALILTVKPELVRGK